MLNVTYMAFMPSVTYEHFMLTVIMLSVLALLKILSVENVLA